MRQIVLCSLLSLALAGCCSDQANPSAMGASSCLPPPAVAAAAAPEEGCGAYPAEALPGQVWCCELFQPPAAAPQKVMTQPESCKEIAIPAVYETYTEQALVSPEHTDWQRVECAPAQTAAGQAECWQLVTTPAVYQTVEKQRLVTPASVRYERVPAVFESVQSAPPPAIRRWVRHTECEVVAAPAAAAPCVK